MAATARARADFIALLVRECEKRSVYEVSQFCRKVMRAGATYLRYQETACNRGLTEGEQDREAKLEARVKLLCEPFDIVPIFSGDPRGATIKLRVPSGIANDWGQVGICVPTS